MTVPIILADDHPFIRSGVESFLKGSNFELVASVGTGAAALTAIAEHDPAIAILDVRMPGGSGIEVLQMLRLQGDERPVVLLTADLEDQALLSALAAGVQGVVMKEGGEIHLIDCLEVVLAGGRWIPAEISERATQVQMARDNSPFKRLTPREAEMAWLVAQNMRNRDIGERFGLTEGAVKFALHGVFRKLEVTSRTELAMLLQRYGCD